MPMPKARPSTKPWMPIKKHSLRNLGDSVNQAYYPYAPKDTCFSTGAITVSTGRYSFSTERMIPSTSIQPIPTTPNTPLSFIEVGANQSVITFLILMEANGKVYPVGATTKWDKTGEL